MSEDVQALSERSEGEDRALRLAIVTPNEFSTDVTVDEVMTIARQHGAVTNLVRGAQLRDLEHGHGELDGIVGFHSNRDLVRRAAATRHVPCAVVDDLPLHQLVPCLRRADTVTPVLSALVIGWSVPVISLRHLSMTLIRGELVMTVGGVRLGVATGTVDFRLDAQAEHMSAVEITGATGGQGIAERSRLGLDDHATIDVAGSATVTADGHLRRLPESATIQVGPHHHRLREAYAVPERRGG